MNWRKHPHISLLQLLVALLGFSAAAPLTSQASNTRFGPASPNYPDIVNGGFKTGDFTSWTLSGQFALVTIQTLHSGRYAAQLSTRGNFGASYIYQRFISPIEGY